MAKDPAFLFYSQDFYSGTRLMTPEERACYIDLLIYQHQNGFIPLDLDRVVMFCSGVAKATLQATLQAKFKQVEKGWYNQRLRVVMDERNEYKSQQSDSGLLGAFFKKAKASLPLKKYNKIKAYIYNDYGKDKLLTIIKTQATHEATLKGLLKHLENEIEDENEIENKDVIENDYEILEYPSFDDFWELYDKKVDKVATEKKWGKLTQEEKEQAIEYIPQYKLSEPDKTFRKNPLTFINNKSWNNEIITKSRSGNDAKIPLASSFTPEDFGM
jgi:uncharacterized protein YdaU (DUF1376 family)